MSRKRPSEASAEVDEGRRPLPGPDFYLSPHPEAPLFSVESRSSAILTIRQLAEEVAVGNYPTTESFLALLRQAGLVSLYFFLKFILGTEGPYDELDADLHREMCNFRQSEWCMAPGARAAVLVPRGFFKSTIFTHGGGTWELTRDANLTLVIANATAGKAESFRGVIKDNVDRIQLYRVLYPERCPAPNAKRWNDKELVFPGRIHHRSEPSVMALGVGASGEGFHYDLFNPDDLVGLDDLDAEHMGNMNMLSKVQWFKTNQRALLRSQKRSRIIYCATFFSPDDPSSLIIENAKLILGYKCEEYTEKPSGTWVVYNRLGVEDDVEVNPDVVTKELLSKQLDEDFWGAQTQSMNRPSRTGLAEFGDFRVKPAWLEWVEEDKRWWVILGGDTNFDDDERRRKPLSAFDVVMAVDPASTERGMTAKTSRTAIVIWAGDAEGNFVLLWRRVGYYAAVTLGDEGTPDGGWFTYLFEGARKFNGSVRECEVEAAAMQKILAPILTKESRVQQFPLYFHPMPATGDKDARIRLCLEPKFKRGQIYAVVGEDSELKAEMKVFPGSKWRKDTLDASEKAITSIIPPEAPEELEARERAEESALVGVNVMTGY